MAYDKTLYTYKGPVTSFGRVIKEDWYSRTLAVSKKKAINNLKHQFRVSHGYSPTYNIDIDPKLVKEA